MNEPIDLDLSDDAIVEGNEIPEMPPTVFNTPRGPVLTQDYPGICSIGMVRGNGCSSVAVMVYDTKPIDGHGHGLGLGSGTICQLTPEQARNFGASLIDLADKIDGGRRQ